MLTLLVLVESFSNRIETPNINIVLYLNHVILHKRTYHL